MSYPYPNDYYSGHSGSSSGHHHTELQRTAYNTVKGKERARDDATRWTDPISVQAGVFEGKVVRFCLRCVQEPISGKRKTEKDRRPLAPVPILRLWVRQCQQNAMGIWTETDLDLTHIESSHLVCEVELSPEIHAVAEGMTESMRTQGPIIGESAHLYDPSFHPYRTGDLDSSRPPMMSYQSNPGIPPLDAILPRQIFPYDRGPTIPPPITQRASWTANEHWDTRSSMNPSMSQQSHLPEQTKFRGSDGLESVTGRSRKTPRVEGMYEADEADEADDVRVRAGKKPRQHEERNMFGTLHVSGQKVVAPTGELGLWFLFTDICMKAEGIYSLRFRVFDLSVIMPQMPPVPPFVHCESQSFKVYSPRAFPGLPKPSELSEHFIRQGFKLNTRKNERTAKSVSPEPIPLTPQPPPPPPQSHYHQSGWGGSSGPFPSGYQRPYSAMDPPPPPPRYYDPR